MLLKYVFSFVNSVSSFFPEWKFFLIKYLKFFGRQTEKIYDKIYREDMLFLNYCIQNYKKPGYLQP